MSTNHTVASGVATDSAGAVSETETYIGKNERFGVVARNIDSGIDYKVEVSADGSNWFDHGTSQTGVTSAEDDNLQTAAFHVRVNITSAGAADETGDFEVFAK